MSIESTSNTKNDSVSSKPGNDLLRDTFAQEIAEDLTPKQQNGPVPLYTELSRESEGSSNIFMVSDTHDLYPERPKTSVREEINFLWKASFYKSWLLVASIKYATLYFWIFFPTYLFFEMDQLKVKQTTFLVGCMGLGGLFLAIFSPFLPVQGMRRQNMIALFSFFGAAGYFSK